MCGWTHTCTHSQVSQSHTLTHTVSSVNKCTFIFKHQYHCHSLLDVLPAPVNVIIQNMKENLTKQHYHGHHYPQASFIRNKSQSRKKPTISQISFLCSKITSISPSKAPCCNNIYICHYALQIANAVLAWTVLHWLQPHCLWFLAYCKDSKKYLLPELSTALPHTELFFLEHVFFWSQSETAMPRSKKLQSVSSCNSNTFPGTACKISLSTTPGHSLETIPGDFLRTFHCGSLQTIPGDSLETIPGDSLQTFPSKQGLKKNQKKIWATVVNNLWWQLQTNLDFDNHINC